MFIKELMIEGGRAFQQKKEAPPMEGPSDRTTSLLPSLLVMNREDNDKTKQTKKSKLKLKWLIKKMPRAGTRANEKFVASKK